MSPPVYLFFVIPSCFFKHIIHLFLIYTYLFLSLCTSDIVICVSSDSCLICFVSFFVFMILDNWVPAQRNVVCESSWKYGLRCVPPEKISLCLSQFPGGTINQTGTAFKINSQLEVSLTTDSVSIMNMGLLWEGQLVASNYHGNLSPFLLPKAR